MDRPVGNPAPARHSQGRIPSHPITSFQPAIGHGLRVSVAEVESPRASMASKEIAKGACGAGPACIHALRRSPIGAGAGALAMAVGDDVWGLGMWRGWVFRAW
ncbi:hypothetical protein [Pontibacter sp. G13]|uniref:hypothetical protein n=1 Tax=Pontibacter sp. G13 TaxID=3074898 RepID=UPI00288B571D|nr:hypothetical protein [Pontibacter sp. G13]WNJ20003.1 hypothetical protein RJD25_05925 [Pontibacter sp. G13]